jgi:hypothetical protein
LSDTSFADGTVGNAYPPTTLTQTGGVGTIAFALTTGALPPGVTLSPAGTLSGTPTDAGAFTFTIAATDSNGCSGTRTYTMTVGGPPVMSLSLARLNYGVLTAAGGAWTLQTPSQTLGLSQAGAGAVTWTATASQPWISVSPSFGSGAAILTISVTDTGALPSPAALSGTITIATAGAANSPSAAVNLALYPGTTTPAIGVFDTPVDGSTALQGSFAVTGWAFDDIGVDRVEIWRDLQPGETTPPFASSASDPRNGKIYIGNGAFVAGSRPDVEAFGPLAPLNYRAGWGYLLLTWGLWNQGNGTFTLHAFAFDLEGKLSTLGRKTIGVANAQADRPFGSIDTPGIGGTATRTVVNFGWGLTPLVNGSATCRIPSTGVQVSIDSGPLQPVAYGDARSDIVGAFPGFSNTDAAGGHFIFDSTQLTNGTHTIGWFITDDCNRADGVGSRFFTVQNGAAIPALTSTLAPAVSAQAALDVADSADPITVSHGHGNLPAIVAPDSTGLRVIHVGQGERIEVRLPTGYDEAFQAVNGVRRALPAGASWDASSRTFFWQPAAPFLGSYDLLFPRNDAQIRVRIVVGAAKP